MPTAEDGYGPVVSREWKIGSNEFKPMTHGEWSTLAPSTPGELVCILRLTDSDGLTGYDTMVVKVVHSSDNTLSELKSNLGVFSPGFRKDILDYMVTLAPADSVLALYPGQAIPGPAWKFQGWTRFLRIPGPCPSRWATLFSPSGLPPRMVPRSNTP